MTAWGIVRWKRVARPRPRQRATTSATSRPKVVVLIPPPVEPGEAPTNMRKIVKKSVSGRRPGRSRSC